ncbi:hypothetical protein SAMN05443544_0567 [Agromyces cerinus subsp. cerinus]|uniref:Uncharacterized protein n=1 Tax=Agromyces cerinus subsp. cerinus TaxID=232089 RepID=A0A1N6DPR2_9MICO|nr:hypothetical protein SAMN05443544_0567 [Agromyces cerinus subsp. cerinus]
MFTCEYPNCGAEYTSAFAAGECEEQDRREDRNTRGWAKRYDFHRKD